MVVINLSRCGPLAMDVQRDDAGNVIDQSSATTLLDVANQAVELVARQVGGHGHLAVGHQGRDSLDPIGLAGPVARLDGGTGGQTALFSIGGGGKSAHWGVS